MTNSMHSECSDTDSDYINLQYGVFHVGKPINGGNGQRLAWYNYMFGR